MTTIGLYAARLSATPEEIIACVPAGDDGTLEIRRAIMLGISQGECRDAFTGELLWSNKAGILRTYY